VHRHKGFRQKILAFAVKEVLYEAEQPIFNLLINNILTKSDRKNQEAKMMAEPIYESDLSINEKVLMGIVRAAEIFKRNHSAVFRNYGLSFPQYNVLRVLEASKNSQNKMSDISRIMLVPDANITGIAKRLEKEGFIIKKSDPADERVTILEISPKGKRTLKNIENEKDEWLDLMLKNLSEIEKLELLDKVKRILKNGMYVK
jgi:MarR family 2-MHQ and catechol resistance regulon transcriptional repressor